MPVEHHKECSELLIMTDIFHVRTSAVVGGLIVN